MATATNEFVVRFRAEGAKELQDAFRKTGEESDKAGDKFKGGGRKYKESTDSILENSRRVKTNIRGLAEDFAAGASSTDLLKESALRLSEVLRLGLGPGIAVGVGVALYEAVRRTKEESDKLRLSIAALTSDKGNIRPLEDIESHLTAIVQARQQIYDLEKSQTHLFGLGIKTAFTPQGFGPNPFQQERAENEKMLAALFDSEKRDLQAVAKTEQSLTFIAQQRLSGSEKEAALEEAKVSSLLKQAAAFEKFNKAGHGKELNEILDEQSKQYDLQRRKIEDQDKLRKESNDHARDLAKIDEKGLTPLDDKLRKLGLEVKYREKLLQLAGSIEAKDKASADLAGAKANQTNAIRNAGLEGMQPVTAIPQLIQNFLDRLMHPFDSGPLKREQATQAEDLARAQAKQGDLVESERLHRLADALEAEADAIKAGREQLEADARKRLFGQPNQDTNAPVGRDFSGISSLSGADFSSMKSLDGADFSGLKELDGLSISIR
jgi:hypothetical protein